MKRIIVCFFSFIIFCFCAGCSNSSKTASASSLDIAVTEELEQIENIESFDDETIKALSVIIRTKKKNNFSTSEYSPKNEHIYNIVKSTTGEVLENNSSNVNFSYEENDEWSVEIKKFEVLKYLSKSNISLSNISSLEPVFDENNNLLGLNIGSKFISYEELEKEFNLPSNKITNIENKSSSIVLTGTYDKSVFNIKKSLELSKNGNNYKAIINHFYGDFLSI